ncbi:MAG: phosphatase PAP2 family protein [Massilia sp.]
MSAPRFPRLRVFVAARLSREGAAGLHLSVGLLLLMLGAWLFGALASDVVAGRAITVLDSELAQRWHHHGAALNRFMLLITHLHGTVGVNLMALLAAIHFYRRKALYWLAALVLAVPGGMLVNVMLKYIFQRARPSFDDPLLTLATYSFPSGHTSGAAMLYGLLAAYLVVNGKGWWVRTGAVLLACAMVTLVGLSRMVLGAHYLSDVLAGAIEAVCWLAICITAVSCLRRRRDEPLETNRGAGNQAHRSYHQR